MLIESKQNMKQLKSCAKKLLLFLGINNCLSFQIADSIDSSLHPWQVRPVLIQPVRRSRLHRQWQLVIPRWRQWQGQQWHQQWQRGQRWHLRVRLQIHIDVLGVQRVRVRHPGLHATEGSSTCARTAEGIIHFVTGGNGSLGGDWR